MARNLDADRVDQDRALEPRRPGNGHLGSDPPANGIADDCDTRQVEIAKEPEIELRQLPGGSQTLRTDSSRETRVGGRDDASSASFGEEVSEAFHRERSGPSVEDQVGVAATPLGELQLNSSCVRHRDRVVRGHSLLSLPAV